MRQSVPWLLLVLVLTSAACSSTTTRRPVAEAPPAVYQPSPESTPVRLGVATAAKPAEVQAAVKRVFKDAAVIDPNYNPNFLDGDFNGDGSQDLAVILKPVKLDEMNQELPPWLVRDPHGNKVNTARLHIEKDEVLLAVIHGFGANDWRDPEATQTFVLKNVAGNDLKVHTGKEFVTANSGRQLPRPQGDLIGGNLQGNPGYLYYASATYSWYDPRTFKGTDTPPGVFHKSRTMR
jgi:hypothetical protein